MTSVEPNSAASQPPRSPFQFSLRTLLLLFVVAASSLAVFGAGGIVVFMLVVGLAIVLREANRLWSLAHLVVLILCLLCLSGWLLETYVNVPRENSRRASCLNKLSHVALALSNYHSTYGHFPPAFTVDKNGKPLHSWRTLVLPDLECNALYKSLDLTQPWDGPQNKALVATELWDYVCPSDPGSSAHTSYVAVVGTNAAWAGDKPRTLADFGNDASDTIMLVEVINSGIPWAEPGDLSLDTLGLAKSTLPAIATVHHYGNEDGFFFKYDHGSGVHVVMVDRNVRFLRTDNLSTEDLRSVLQIGGCKKGTIGYRALMNDDTGRRLNWPNIAALAVWLVSVGTLLAAAVRSRKARFAPSPPAVQSCQNGGM